MIWRGLGGSILVLASTNDLPLTITVVLAVLGLGLLADAWLDLLAAAADPSTADLRLVQLATVVWTAPLLMAPPMFSRDGWSYAAQSWMVHLGLDPYTQGPAALGDAFSSAVAPIWRHTPAPYGPLPLWLGSLGAGHADSPLSMVHLHRGLAVIGLVLLAWAVPRLARFAGANPVYASAVVMASPLMIANGIAGLHNDLLMAGLMAAAVVVAAERGWLLGAIVTGLAVSVKLPGGAAALAVVLVTLPTAASLGQRLARTLQVVAAAAVTVVAIGSLSGLGTGWIHALSVPGVVVTPLSVTSVIGHAFDVTTVTRASGQLLIAALGAALVLLSPTGDRRRAVGTMAVFTTVLVLLAPVVHLWYVLWAWPFVACVAATTAGGWPWRLVRLWGVAGGLFAPLQSSLAGSAHAIAVGVVLACSLTVVLAPQVWRRDPTRSGRTASERPGSPPAVQRPQSSIQAAQPNRFR